VPDTFEDSHNLMNLIGAGDDYPKIRVNEFFQVGP